MHKNPLSIDADDSFLDALQLMRKHKLSHLVVTRNKNAELAGIIAKRDVLEQLVKINEKTTGKTYSNLEMKALKIGDFMSKNPLRLEANQNIKDAIRVLVENKISCLPVMEEGNLVGTVSSDDILKSFLDKD